MLAQVVQSVVQLAQHHMQAVEALRTCQQPANPRCACGMEDVSLLLTPRVLFCDVEATCQPARVL
eukprot:1138339-Pelagomonas_calceolata.AAC.6